MLDLYVIEGFADSGKSTLVMHLAGVGQASSVKELKLRTSTKTFLVIYSSANEGSENYGTDGKKKPNQRMTPDELHELIESYSADIDAVLVPLRPSWGSHTSQDYVNALTTGSNAICQLAGYVGIGRPTRIKNQNQGFNVTSTPVAQMSTRLLLHSLSQFRISPPNYHFDNPSNEVAEIVRNHWRWV